MLKGMHVVHLIMSLHSFLEINTETTTNETTTNETTTNETATIETTTNETATTETTNEMQEEKKLEVVMLNPMSPTRSVEYWLPDLELHVLTNMNCSLEKWLSDKHI